MKMWLVERARSPTELQTRLQVLTDNHHTIFTVLLARVGDYYDYTIVAYREDGEY